MRRDIQRLANETFDLLVIGGGVTGACVARDAALRGLRVALIEKNDFAHATSAHNSKLIHGGLRYLRNFELGLVRESLRERRIWQRTAPHLVRPLPFLVPLYNAGFKGRATLLAGLALYDMLSFDRGWLKDPDQRLPGHSFLSKREAIKREPLLEGQGFEGSFLYYDAQMYAPERLALECIIDATAQGAAVANHCASDGLLVRNGVVEGAKAHDLAGDARFDIRAKVTLVAAGPWADIFLAQALGKPATHKLLRAKGIHLIVPAMTKTDALTVAAGGGHFFVLPWRGHSLLGTTDTAFRSKPDDVGVTESDIDDFLAFINANLPSAKLSRAKVQHWYAGLRPLVDDGSGDTYDASRRAELVDHSKDDGLNNLFSAIGGKWTTSRDLAQKTVDTLVAKLGVAAKPCPTGTAPTPGGNIPRFAAFKAQMETEHDPVPNIDHLARLYGTRVREVLALGGNRPDLREPLSESGDIGAQVLFAIREEAALTLDDVVMRRTGIGQLGSPGEDRLKRVADLMAGELGWDDARKQSELAAVQKNFQLHDGAAVSALVVVNPRSGGGRTAREWPKIETALRAIYPNMAVAATSQRNNATAIVRQALLEGHSEIVAVGGDGTINECVNGFFVENGPISPDAVFAFVTSGTGGDFRKSFGIDPGHEASIARLGTAKVRAIDVGRVSCITQNGAPTVRYFINIASFGMSGLIVDSVNRAFFAKLFGGRFAFAFHSLMGMLRYKDRAVRIRVDGSYDEIASISTVAVANGLYFGGGMKVAPNAKPDDGEFDVIVMGGGPKSRAAADMKLIYTGEHLNNPAVRALRGQKIVAVPVAETGGHPVLIEVDGESAGRLPATFEILPRALNLRC